MTVLADMIEARLQATGWLGFRALDGRYMLAPPHTPAHPLLAISTDGLQLQRVNAMGEVLRTVELTDFYDNERNAAVCIDTAMSALPDNRAGG